MSSDTTTTLPQPHQPERITTWGEVVIWRLQLDDFDCEAEGARIWIVTKGKKTIGRFANVVCANRCALAIERGATHEQ